MIWSRSDAVVLGQGMPDQFPIPVNQKTGRSREILALDGVGVFVADAEQIHQFASPVHQDREIRFDGLYHLDGLFRIHEDGDNTDV